MGNSGVFKKKKKIKIIVWDLVPGIWDFGRLGLYLIS